MLSFKVLPLPFALFIVATRAIQGDSQNGRPTFSPSSASNSSTSNISPIGFDNVQCSPSTALHASSDTCIKALYSILSGPGAFAPKSWNPGDAQSWDVGTGCSISAIAGVTSAETLSPSCMVGPVIWAVSRCFTGNEDEANGMATMKVGPNGGVHLKIVLGPPSENTTTGGDTSNLKNIIRGLERL